MNEPSQAEANKVARVLSGTRLKYTITLHMKSGVRYEYQSDSRPTLDYNDEARCVWIKDGYDNYKCRESEVELIHCEENPK